MKRVSFRYIAVGLSLLIWRGALAQAGDAERVAVTVYSSADPASFSPQHFIAQQRADYGSSGISPSQVPGYGVVREERRVRLEPGVSELKLSGVPQFIDPTTVSLKDLSDTTDVVVREQNFEFDLASPSKVLERYLDRPVGVELAQGDKIELVSGTLISSVQNQLLLKTPDGLRLIPGYGSQLRLGDLPDGLITRPTLVWRLQSKTGGERRIQTTYQTEGITWRADYNVVLNEAETLADISAWVSLMNLSGASFKDAQLKLVAGDVQRIAPRGPQYRTEPAYAAELSAMSDVGFEQKSFFEYHLYTLPRTTTIPSNATQQIALFPDKRGVKVKKALVYYGLSDFAAWQHSPSPRTARDWGNQSQNKVDVYVQFENRENNKLGIPFPKGKVRLYKTDQADGALEFIGEDVIDHTPKDGLVRVKVGQSFDVVGERTQKEFSAEYKRNHMRETIEIRLKNSKDQPQEVLVREHLLRWVNWNIVTRSDDFEKIDARTVHFPVKVPANGEKVVTYTVEYNW